MNEAIEDVMFVVGRDEGRTHGYALYHPVHGWYAGAFSGKGPHFLVESHFRPAPPRQHWSTFRQPPNPQEWVVDRHHPAGLIAAIHECEARRIPCEYVQDHAHGMRGLYLTPTGEVEPTEAGA